MSEDMGGKMSGLWNKTLVYFGFADDVTETVEEDEDDGTSGIFEMPPTVRKISRSENKRSIAKPFRRPGNSHIRPVSASQGKVHVIDPINFNPAQRVDYTKKVHTPVILNLQQVDPNLSKRIIDFVSGLTYAVDGGIQKVAEKVFLLTPKDIEVSAEEKKRLQQKGFFNQF